MSGSNVPIVLVHGLFGDLGAASIIDAFGNVSIHAPDLIGYGQFADADTGNLTLADQADHVARFISSLPGKRAHLVGHSIGGAVAVLVAIRHPEKVVSLTSVEGNFTLNDAFWSGQIARMSDQEVDDILAGYKENPSDWLESAGIAVDDDSLLQARAWFDRQPASTIKAQAKAVVTATARESYLSGLRDAVRGGLPFYLIAGARSAEGWDVPRWANRECRIRINIPGVGHMMMAQDPRRFAKAVLTCVTSL